MKYLSILFLLALASCGGGGGSVPSTVGSNTTGDGCTIEQHTVGNLSGVLITCDSGSEFIPNGVNGNDGSQGVQGEKGDKGDTGSNVFADALAIHTSKRKSIFRIKAYCEYDIDGGTTFGAQRFKINVNGNFQAATYPEGGYDIAHHYGSGFLITSDKIVSNSHVLGDESCAIKDSEKADPTKPWIGRLAFAEVRNVSASTDNIENGTSTTWPRQYITTSTEKDVATIDISLSSVLSNLPAFEVENTIPSVLTPTMSMSFPLGIVNMMTNLGEIVTDDWNSFNLPPSGHPALGVFDLSFFQYDFAVSNDTDGGSSGSPIINVNTGKVIGILTAGFNNSEVVINPGVIVAISHLDVL